MNTPVAHLRKKITKLVTVMPTFWYFNERQLELLFNSQFELTGFDFCSVLAVAFVCENGYIFSRGISPSYVGPVLY